MMSEGITSTDAFLLLAEIARLRARAEQAEALALTLQSQRDRAEADAAAYRRIIDVLSRAGDLSSMRGVASAALARLHPGTALLAELEAARAIVKTLRMHRDAGGEVWHSIDADLAAYDEAITKARAT